MFTQKKFPKQLLIQLNQQIVVKDWWQQLAICVGKIFRSLEQGQIGYQSIGLDELKT